MLFPSDTKPAHTLESWRSLFSHPKHSFPSIHTAGPATSCSSVLVRVPSSPASASDACSPLLPSVALLSPVPCRIFFHSPDPIIHTGCLLTSLFLVCLCFLGLPGGSVVKNLPASAGDIRDVGSIPRSGRPPGGGHGNPLQYSCLENPMDSGFWWATIHGLAKSRT